MIGGIFEYDSIDFATIFKHGCSIFKIFKKYFSHAFLREEKRVILGKKLYLFPFFVNGHTFVKKVFAMDPTFVVPQQLLLIFYTR